MHKALQIFTKKFIKLNAVLENRIHHLLNTTVSLLPKQEQSKSLNGIQEEMHWSLSAVVMQPEDEWLYIYIICLPS